MSAGLVLRFDRAGLGTPTRTPQGFLRIPAFLTKVGVFTYTRADGTIVRELRPAEEVFKADSLATLSAAPLTHRHPPEMISPKNVRTHAIGHVSEQVKRDGERVSADVTVQDEDAIAAVERGELREISCGYRCRIDATPGTFNGQPYDQVQRDITYNHAALGPRNWGRAGTDVALRMDSSSAVSAEMIAAEGGQPVDLVTIKLGGKDVQVTPQAAAALELEGLLTKVRALLGDSFNADKLETTRDVMVAAIMQMDPRADASALASKSDGYVTGLFDALVERRQRAAPSSVRSDGERRIQPTFPSAYGGLQAAALATAGAPVTRRDFGEPGGTTVPKPPPSPSKPYVPPWMAPLSTSKDTAAGLESTAQRPPWMQPLSQSKDR